MAKHLQKICEGKKRKRQRIEKFTQKAVLAKRTVDIGFTRVSEPKTATGGFVTK